MKNVNKLKSVFNCGLRMRILIPVVFAVIIGFTLTGCDQPSGPENKGNSKKPLDTPANVRVDDAGKTAFVLRWNAVPEVDKYELDIDGKLTQLAASITHYDLRDLTENPKVYSIRVRAVAANGDEAYKDSAYSAPLEVEPAEYMFILGDETPAQNILFARSGARNAARAAGNGQIIKELTPFGKSLERIVIPPTIGSRTVTAIGDDAFKDNKMTSISLPETIITIGAGSFSGTNIASIIIPESVINIGDGAFSNCIVLVIVVFVSVEDIHLGNGVFTGTDAIESIFVPEGSGDAFAKTIAESMPELAEKIVETKLTGIEISKNPSKTTYTAGETLNTNGIEVIAVYSDGKKEPITSGLTFSHTTLHTAGTITITVTYQGRNAAFTVTVNPSTSPVKTLTSIDVSKNPSKTTYAAGETLNTNGIEVIAMYSDGTEETITSGLTFSHTTLHTAGTITVTVTYQGRSAAFTVTVNAPPPEDGNAGLSVNFTITDAHITSSTGIITNLTLYQSAVPAQTAVLFVQNSSQYSSIKWKVQNTAIEEEGASFTIQADNQAFIPNREYFVTVELMKNGVPYSRTVLLTVISEDDPSQPATISGITVTKNPIKTAYIVGETLNTAGIEVTAAYSDGTSRTVVSGLTFSHVVFNTVGIVTVTVTYQGRSAVFTVTVSDPVIGPPDDGNTGNITINFTITDALITSGSAIISDLVLYRNSGSWPQTAVLSVQNSSQYSSIKWKVQNTAIEGAGASLTIEADNQAFIVDMEYFVTVELIKGGIPYNKIILLTVRN